MAGARPVSVVDLIQGLCLGTSERVTAAANGANTGVHFSGWDPSGNATSSIWRPSAGKWCAVQQGWAGWGASPHDKHVQPSVESLESRPADSGVL
jgi:hypothetical protein